MPEGQDAFQDRIARLNAKEVTAARFQDLPQTEPVSTSRPVPLVWRMATPILGLVVLTGFVLWVWPALEPIFVAGDDPLRQGSFLERAVLDRMSDDEIRQMNAESRLDGKSQMERLILSR